MKVAAIALANKIARMAWAMMARANATKNPSPFVNEIAPVIGRDVEGWEDEQHVMQSRSIRTQMCQCITECGLLTGTRSAEGHYGQR